MEKLKGEGDRKIVEKVRVRRTCDACGAPATRKHTYLNEGSAGARNNTNSSAYGRDDCSWCSDYDQYLCQECHKRDVEDDVPQGYKWCATFSIERFPHMFLWWQEREIERTEESTDLSQFEGM